MKVINLIVKDLDALIYRAGKRLGASNEQIQCAIYIAEQKMQFAIEVDMKIKDEESMMGFGRDAE